MRRIIVLLLALLLLLPVATSQAQTVPDFCYARFDAAFAQTYATAIWQTCGIGNSRVVTLYHGVSGNTQYFTDRDAFLAAVAGYVQTGVSNGSYFEVSQVVPLGSNLVPPTITGNFCDGGQVVEAPQTGLPYTCLSHHGRTNYWRDGVAYQATWTDSANTPITTLTFIDNQVNTAVQNTNHLLYNVFVSAIPPHDSCQRLTLGSRWYVAAVDGLFRRVLEDGRFVRQENDAAFRFNTQVTIQADSAGGHCYLNPVNNTFYVHTGNQEYVMAHWLMPYPVYFDSRMVSYNTYTSTCYEYPEMVNGLPQLSPGTQFPLSPNSCY